MSPLRAAVARFGRATAGNIGLAFGIALLPIAIIVGATLDYQRAANAKIRLQAAVDEAALLVAKNTSVTQTARQQLAQSSVLANLGALASVVNPVVTETEPTTGSYQVAAHAVVPTTVMQVVNFRSITINAKAVATVAASSSTSSVCMYALSKTASPGILANSNVVINATGCEIDVASTGNPAMTVNSGDTFNVSKLCVAGTNILNNAGSIPALTTGCTVPSDPFASSLPSVAVGSCTVSNQNYSGSATLSPGVYCGGFNFNGSGTLTLNSGLYIFKGTSWNLNSGWNVSGSGVTLYFADTSYIQVNSGVNIQLTAPTSGTYANILMFEPQGLTQSSFTINGGAGHTLQGLIYLPSRNITFNSMSNVTAEALTIVVNSLLLDTLNWNITNSAYSVSGSGSSYPKLTQ